MERNEISKTFINSTYFYVEIFGLGVLMILGGSLAEYTLSSFSVVFIYSGVFVLIWGLGLFYWKVIQKGMDWIKELKNISKE